MTVVITGIVGKVKSLKYYYWTALAACSKSFIEIYGYETIMIWQSQKKINKLLMRIPSGHERESYHVYHNLLKYKILNTIYSDENIKWQN